MKKLIMLLTAMVISTVISFAECYRVEGYIITYKVYYDSNKHVLYEEEQGSQYYSREIQADSQEDAKAQAMRECESMCYSSDDVREIRENGQVIGYYRLMRRTRIDSCNQSYGC